MSILEQIITPEDLQSYSVEQLETLAQEIRERIISVLSTTGGHLASNLGVVELTIALHYVFRSPSDKFIFDVSHQSYVHKLLTGRNDRFETIRQFKGLCGFTHPDESIHDHFYAGHAGTALSLALGMAKARDLSQKSNYILPIIGDASLTCGLTLEALNNVPEKLPHFITILNDNEMSISNNVGNIKNILSRLLSNPFTNRIYEDIQGVLSKIPGFGNTLAKQGKKLRESLKNLFSSATFFEEFNLNYIGPIDGHDVKKLIDTFQALKENQRPTLVHVLTVKGKGLPIATKNPISYHGVKPFDVTSGKFHASASSKPTFPKIFGSHILQMAEKDPNLLAITPAMPAGSCLTEFMSKFPKRCIDVGIAEGHSLTYAGGIAKDPKKKVIASIYATFLQRAMDNLFQDICLQKVPVVLTLDRAGISGPDGSTHHGIYDIGFLHAMPNMIIAQPRNGQVLRELLQSAFDWKQPTAIRYPNLPTTDATTSLLQRVPGKGEVLRQGKDICIVALGHMNTTALEVANKLEEQKVQATIVDPVFVKPLDVTLFTELFKQHKILVTIEEHSIKAGLAMILNSFIIQNEMRDINIMNFGIPDRFIHHGKTSDLLKSIGLDVESITHAILTKFYAKQKVCP